MSGMDDLRYKYFMDNCGFDYILEVREGKDFLEIVSSMGGDVTTNRVYGKPKGNPEDFEIYER